MRYLEFVRLILHGAGNVVVQDSLVEVLVENALLSSSGDSQMTGPMRLDEPIDCMHIPYVGIK